MQRILIRTISLLFVLCFISQLTSCKENSSTEPEVDSKVTKWEEDINYFDSELKSKQYKFSSLISIQRYNNAITDIKNSIDSLRDYEIYLKLQQLVASFNVAHIVLYASSQLNFHLLPFYTYSFSDGIYIIMADQNNSNLLGKKIIGYGGEPIKTVEDSLRKIISYENDYWFKEQLPKALSNVEVLKYYGFTSSLSSVDIDIEGIGKVTVNSVESAPGMNHILDGKIVPLYLQNQSSNYWDTFIEANRVLFIKYNKCSNAINFPFTDFTNVVKEFISSHQVDKVVIDLRNNGGGNSSIINPLLDYLKSSSFNQAGKLFIAVNRGTFSSALLNSISFSQQTNCILVGEPTGGKPNSYGEVLTFTLPNSQTKVQYCKKYFQTMSEDPEALFPDHSIEITFGEYINCKDPVIDFILDY